MASNRMKTQKEMMDFLTDSCVFINSEMHDALQKRCDDSMRLQKAISIAMRLRTLLNDEGEERFFITTNWFKKRITL